MCSALGMLVINSIEKTRLSADSYSYSGTGVAWKARLVLFLGFALMAGGLAGSVVRYSNSPIAMTFESSLPQAVLVLKYVVPEYPFPTLYFGIANVIANGLIMLRYLNLIGHVQNHPLTCLLARLCFGSHKIWKMITHITWRCKPLSALSIGICTRYARSREELSRGVGASFSSGGAKSPFGTVL